MRTTVLSALALLGISALAIGWSLAPVSTVIDRDTQAAITPDSALQRLLDGNARFAAGNLTPRNFPAQVQASAKAQHPFAVVLGCIDSRTPPEILFDQGIGDIFAPRIAGNFASDEIIGSIEFATKVAGAKLVLVVGHTGCGAIMGAADKVRLGNLTSVIEAIEPAKELLQDKTAEASSQNPRFVADLTQANVRHTVNRLRSSEILARLEAEGKLRIVGALYDLSTGKVTLLN